MITPRMCLDRYGNPEDQKYVAMWDVPAGLEVGTIPKRIYCNKDMVEPLSAAFRNLIQRGLVGELKTWDGCFNIRKQRGANSQSLHSWGTAIDVNASWNQLNEKSTLSTGFVQCFKDAGFDWGGDFHNRKDPMHFQLANFPN